MIRPIILFSYSHTATRVEIQNACCPTPIDILDKYSDFGLTLVLGVSLHLWKRLTKFVPIAPRCHC